MTSKRLRPTASQYRSKLALIAGGIVAVISMSGCSVLLPQAKDAPSAPTSTVTATPTYTLGTPIEINDSRGNAAKITILSAKFTDEKPAKYAPEPKSGKYLILEVLWEGTAGKTMAGSTYVNVRDDDGNRAPHSVLVDDGLPSGYVIIGDKSKGIVAFDAKPGPVSIIINDMTLQREYARVKLVL